MTKTNSQVTLICVVEDHGVPGIFVEEGRHSDIRQDNYGQFIEDNNGDEYYLGDFDWQNVFMLMD